MADRRDGIILSLGGVRRAQSEVKNGVAVEFVTELVLVREKEIGDQRQIERVVAKR